MFREEKSAGLLFGARCRAERRGGAFVRGGLRAHRVEPELRAGGGGEVPKMQRQIDALVHAVNALEEGRREPAPHWLFDRESMEAHGVGGCVSGVSLAYYLAGRSGLAPAVVSSKVRALDEWVCLTERRWRQSRSVAQKACLLTGRQFVARDALEWLFAFSSTNHMCHDLVQDWGNRAMLPEWLVEAQPRRTGGMHIAEYLLGTQIVSALSGMAALAWNRHVQAPQDMEVVGVGEVSSALVSLRHMLLAPTISANALFSYIQIDSAILLWQILHLKSWNQAVEKVKALGLLGDLLTLVVPFNQYPMGRIAGWAAGILWGALHESTAILPEFAPKQQKTVAVTH